MHTIERISVEKRGWRKWVVVITEVSVNGIIRHIPLALHKTKREALRRAREWANKGNLFEKNGVVRIVTDKERGINKKS